MSRYQWQAAGIVARNPNVAGFMSAVGSGGSSTGVNSGRLFMTLKPMGQRQERCTFWRVFCHRMSSDEIINEMRPKFARIPGIEVHMQNPPAIRLGGHLTKSLYQYTLTDLNLDELQNSAIKLMNALSRMPGFKDVNTDLQLTSPSLTVTIDRDRAASLGVTPQAVEAALGAAFGGQQISSIYAAFDTYEVILEVLPRDQMDPTALSRIYVTSTLPVTSPTNGTTNQGRLVPLTSVTRTVQSSMPLSINHQGQLPSATISFDMAPGYAMSYATATIPRLQHQLGIPSTVQGGFQGNAQAFQSSTSRMGFLLAIALVTVYIVLGILYESFIHPLTILSGLPSAAVGALITLWLFGVPLSLYAFVGMIMLIGIVKKNAIMMIDFALTRERSEGISADDAILEAALIRFRPIMMTTMAALMGTLPIAIGFGQGGETRRPLGLAVVGGLLLSQLLTLYITPVLYIYLDRAGGWIGNWRGRGRKRLPQPAE
jgi:HAE1 family hydrophobic/amphiphilic exporter-1